MKKKNTENPCKKKNTAAPLSKTPKTSRAVLSRSDKSRPTTQQALGQLRRLLQKRIAAFEEELNKMSATVPQLNTEREIRSVNLLVRTLEKVLEIEARNFRKRKMARNQAQKLDNGRRLELAQRIDALSQTWESHHASQGTTPCNN